MKNLIPKKLSDWFGLSLIIVVAVIPVLSLFWYEPMRMLEEIVAILLTCLIIWVLVYFKKPEQ